MKNFAIATLLLFWFLLTVLLACSFVGLLILFKDSTGDSTWIRVGTGLTNALIGK